MGTHSIRLIVASLFLLAVVVAAISPALSAPATATADGQSKARAEAQVLHDTMRKLWGNQAAFTRLLIVSTVNNLLDAEATQEQLMQNQQAIGEALKPHLGNAAGEELAELLEQHGLIAAQILKASDAGDEAAATDAVKRWYSNADEIALLLSTADSENWPKRKMTAMLREQLALTLQEVLAQLTGDYDGSLAAYKEVQRQALEIADTLSSAIIRQFPDRFRKN